ncbi:hypothetical protein [Snodgrassella communis]|uniref:hypothetical protein n=1 Tax=Snodgrassella communis TaxID=2946699 RepID=UPI001EF3D7B3|nr:hypothetical protein [Snodgrassella communis]WMY91729.1 hypothetical protein PYG29_09930 [Snodgrassella communis]
MENQLEQLEDSVKRLVIHFNSLLAEKHQLTQQLSTVKKQLQQQGENFQAERERMRKQHEQDKFNLQESMQTTIDELIAEKKRYTTVLKASSDELQRLLQRLPQVQEDS